MPLGRGDRDQNPKQTVRPKAEAGGFDLHQSPRKPPHWHCGVVGLAQIAVPAPAVKGLMQTNNSLSAFQIDLSKEIDSAVGALFDGISVQQNRENSSRKR
jgi:hypothetical protein